MGIFNFFNKKQQPEIIQVKSDGGSDMMSFSINYDTSMELQNMYKTGNGYLYGADGLFPQELNRMYHQSPLHSAILNFKKLLACGNGFKIDSAALSVADIIALNQLTTQFENITKDVAMDYFIHSRICLLITWNSDNTKIIKVERVAPEKIRINDVNSRMEPVNFLYNWDWSNSSKYKTITYSIFDQQNKNCKQQLYFYQTSSPGQKLYSEPQYKSALPWLFLDSEMAVYHKSNITNSLNMSLLVQFYEKPGTEEEKQKVKQGLQQTFGGARKAGKVMVHFADGKDLAPTVTQMEPNKLDKTFLSLTDTIQRQLCYAHQIDPQLLGLKTPGSLGNSGEIEISYKIFNSTVIQPAQKDMENIYNELIAVNRLATKIEFVEADIYTTLKTN